MEAIAKLITDNLGMVAGGAIVAIVGAIGGFLAKILADYLAREAARRRNSPDKGDDGPIPILESVSVQISKALDGPAKVTKMDPKK